MAIDNLIHKLLEEANVDNNILKYVYNSHKEFIPGTTPVYYSGPFWDEREITAAIKVLLTGNWLSSGENVQKFEREFSTYFNNKYSVMVNSGSSANLVMIKALKKYYRWVDNDEIIVSVVGFPTTISAITESNLTPVFIDVEFETLNFDLKLIEEKITKHTKAIFLSPVLANTCNLDTILEICKKHNIKLILDNCDSLGSKWNGKYLNEYAVASSCSFYSAHHLSSGEGGMVSSDIEEIIKISRSIAWWGRDCHCVGNQNLLKDGVCKERFKNWIPEANCVMDHKYLFVNTGYNLKPLDFQGAIGSVQLSKFKEIHAKRVFHKNLIQSYFENMHGFYIPENHYEAETSWFGVPIICDNPILKENFVRYLESNKIQTRNYFAGNILLHPAYKHLDDYLKYPMANQVLNRVLFLGCSPSYAPEILYYVEKIIKNFEN